MSPQVNPVKSTFATYGETVDQALRDLGTATPHVQVLKMIAWLFDTNIAFVKRDCQERFLRLREQDRRYTPRG